MNHSSNPAHRCGRFFLAMLAVSCSVPLAGADWPGFRGPDRFGIVNDAAVPIRWSDKQNLKWKLALPGAGFSSPIVVGDSVLVTCYSDADGDLSKLKRSLICVDRRQGEIKWTRVIASTGRESRGAAFGTRHGFASHTPISDGERVYVLFGNSGVLAFDMKGQQLWKADVGAENRSMFGSGASPIIYKNLLIVLAASESESIRALDRKTGKEIWKAEGGSLSRSFCTPVIGRTAKGKDELLVSVPYETWGLDPATGDLNWFAETSVDTNAVPSVVVHDHVAYVIGGRSPGGRAAIRLGGEDDVTKTHVVWSTTGGSYVGSPVLHNGHLYWLNERGIAFCIDSSTGREVARKRIGGRQFYASAVLLNKRLVAVSRFGGTYIFDPTPKLTELARNQLVDTSDFSGSPAISDGQLFLRSDKYLYCISAK